MTTNWAVAAAIVLIFSSSIATGNDIYISNIGDDLELNITQDGENNTIANAGSNPSTLNGDRNELLIKQKNTGQTIIGGTISFDVTGNDNDIELGQGFNGVGLVSTDTTESGAKTIDLDVVGNNNAVHVGQRNGSMGAFHSHEAVVDINGNNNNVYSEQSLDGKKTLSIELTGNGHNVITDQRHTGAHTSTIDLTNGGGAYSLSVMQNSSSPRSYTLTGTCYIANGCSTTVTQ